MGENLGLTGGQSEDLIDEYLEEVGEFPPIASTAAKPMGAPVRTTAPPAAKAAPVPRPAKAPELPLPAEPRVEITALSRALEKQRNPSFENSVGMEMRCVPSGVFYLGSNAVGTLPNERPVSKVTVTCFLMSRHPVTNAQYEQFDPGHRSKRGPWADDDHPVIYVSSREAEKFCEWLSTRERKTYRLPTEAEWEYAARGGDGRGFPWGERLQGGDFANFADANTPFAWRDVAIDDGYAQTSPVGNYPRGASPFGLEDMAGNVHEWCLDYYADYQTRERTNPRGPSSGTKRMYRGGSWKSRANSLRATARAFNQPDYSSNDVGFRVVCEAHA
jgi:formylglycine-generating enzyme required for sulfatase activity